MPGNSKVKCPKSFGHLYVQVRRQNRMNRKKWDKLLSECEVELTGGKVEKREDEIVNSTTYKNLCVGGYTLELRPGAKDRGCDVDVEIQQKGGPPAAGSAADGNEPESSVTIESGKTQMHFFKFLPYELRLKVVDWQTNKELGGVKVTATRVGTKETLGPSTTNSKGIADFGVVPRGSMYTFKVTLSKSDEKKYVPEDQYGPVSPLRFFNDPYVIAVYPIIKIAPKIEFEYKVVLFDRDLGKHQGAAESEVSADPTYIRLSVSHSLKGHPYAKGAKLAFTPKNVEAYTDKACTAKLAKMDLTNDQIKNGLKLYLEGKIRGKFKVTLQLEDPGDKRLELEAKKNPATVEMGVVELKAELYQHNITAVRAIQVNPDTNPIATYHTNLQNTALPAQVLMTDQQKVGTGRLLHVQAASNHGRARLLLKRIDIAHWPSGTDDYELAFNATNTSGAVALYDSEFDGSVHPLPAKVKVKDLKTADKEYWVQGTGATKKKREVRLDLGLDRPEPMTDHATKESAKRNGDWARFTVVQIKEVRVDYTTPAGRATAWNEAQERFYINLQADPNGRRVTIRAQLSQKISDVTIHFMLAEDENNRMAANWGVNLPGTWTWGNIAAAVKHTDKANRRDLLHLSATTDADGKASRELTLSRFGGDRFHPACYIDQDPHLAKYIRGHATLQRKGPVLATRAINVWRRFWYKEVKVTGIVVAGFGNAADTYRDVKAEMVAAAAVEMPLATARRSATPVIFKKHMVSFHLNNARTAYVNNYANDNGDALVVGDATERSFFALATAEADKPVMIPMLNAHALWVADGLTAAQAVPWFRTTRFPLSLTADKKLIDPPLQGGTLFSAGQWTAEDWNPAANRGAGAWGNSRNGNLAAADISLDPGRSNPSAFQVKKPAGIVVSAHGTRVRITGLTLRAGKYYLGTSYPDGIVNAYTPNNVPDFIDTINHELGHSFRQVTTVRPAGIRAHPNQYNRDGSHCNYNNKCCLMYESGPQATALHRYCPICHPYVLVQDMSSGR